MDHNLSKITYCQQKIGLKTKKEEPTSIVSAKSAVEHLCNMENNSDNQVLIKKIFNSHTR